jgi:hypothetical protein
VIDHRNTDLFYLAGLTGILLVQDPSPLDAIYYLLNIKY